MTQPLSSEGNLSAKVTRTETTEVETEQPSGPEGNPDGETDSDD